MRNGPYVLVVAPEDFPGKLYRGKYCYEHHLVWWQNTNEILDGDHIHHRNENKQDNRFNNLERLTPSQHAQVHAPTKRALIHGTPHGFRHWKCRCDKCVNANRQYQREWKRQNSGVPDR